MFLDEGDSSCVGDGFFCCYGFLLGLELQRSRERLELSHCIYHTDLAGGTYCFDNPRLAAATDTYNQYFVFESNWLHKTPQSLSKIGVSSGMMM